MLSKRMFANFYYAMKKIKIKADKIHLSNRLTECQFIKIAIQFPAMSVHCKCFLYSSRTEIIYIRLAEHRWLFQTYSRRWCTSLV